MSSIFFLHIVVVVVLFFVNFVIVFVAHVLVFDLLNLTALRRHRSCPPYLSVLVCFSFPSNRISFVVPIIPLSMVSY